MILGIHTNRSKEWATHLDGASWPIERRFYNSQTNVTATSMWARVRKNYTAGTITHVSYREKETETGEWLRWRDGVPPRVKGFFQLAAADPRIPVWFTMHHEPGNNQDTHGTPLEHRLLIRETQRVAPSNVLVIPVYSVWLWSGKLGDPSELLHPADYGRFPLIGLDVYPELHDDSLIEDAVAHVSELGARLIVPEFATTPTAFESQTLAMLAFADRFDPLALCYFDTDADASHPGWPLTLGAMGDYAGLMKLGDRHPWRFPSSKIRGW